MTQKGPASDSLGKLAARSMGWVVADKWGTRFTSLLILVVLGRLLAPADFGLVALASMFITFAGIFVEQGFGKALVQRQELQPEHIDAAFWTALGVAAVVTLLTVLTAGPIAQAAGLPALAPVLRWLALGLVVNALSSTPSALLERSFGFKSLAIRRLCSTFAGGVAAIGVAFAGGGVWSLVAQTLVGAFAGLVALWAATQWRPRAQFRMSALRELWPVGFGVLGIEIVSFIGSQSDRLLVGAFLGTRALGLYFMAMRIVSIMVEVFASIFSAVSLTMFSRLQQDEARMREWLYRLTAASSALTLPCFALAAALAPVAVPFVIGAQWSASVTIFQIFTLLGAVNSVAYFDRSVLLARGRARAAFLLTLGQAILGVVLVLLAAPYGVLAITVAVVARQYCYWPVRLIVLRRIVGVQPGKYLAQWLRPCVAALAMFAIVYGTSWRWPQLMSLPLPYLVLASLLGAGLYLVLLRLVDRNVFADVRSAWLSLKARNP